LKQALNTKSWDERTWPAALRNISNAAKAEGVPPASLKPCGGIEDGYDAVKIAGNVQDG
jgi:hypothetical protein